MHTRNLKPSMTKHRMTAASVVGLMIAAVMLVLTLAFTGVHTSRHPASSVTSNPSAVALAAEPAPIQQQRVELIRDLRTANLADFDAMERAPGLYIQPESSASIQQHRVDVIHELRAQNLADFDAMERAPGLYT